MRKILILSMMILSLNAHSLKGFVTQDNENLIIKAYYYGNSPCIECEVKISSNNENLYTLKTDKNGILSIKNPNKILEIKIIGGLGHEKVISFEPIIDENLSSNTIKNQKLAKVSDFLQKDDFVSNLVKFGISLVILFIFFGGIYLIKYKRNYQNRK